MTGAPRGGAGRSRSRAHDTRFPWPDERLIKAAQDGDVASLTTVVMESQPHVRKFAVSLCACRRTRRTRRRRR